MPRQCEHWLAMTGWMVKIEPDTRLLTINPALRILGKCLDAAAGGLHGVADHGGEKGVPLYLQEDGRVPGGDGDAGGV